MISLCLLRLIFVPFLVEHHWKKCCNVRVSVRTIVDRRFLKDRHSVLRRIWTTSKVMDSLLYTKSMRTRSHDNTISRSIRSIPRNFWANTDSLCSSHSHVQLCLDVHRKQSLLSTSIFFLTAVWNCLEQPAYISLICVKSIQYTYTYIYIFFCVVHVKSRAIVILFLLIFFIMIFIFSISRTKSIRRE